MSYVEFLRDCRAETIDYDAGRLAELIARAMTDKIAFVPEKKSYIVFDGRLWRFDEQRVQVNTIVIDFIRTLRGYVDALGRERSVKFVERYLNPNPRKGLLDDVRGYCSVPLLEFDRLPFSINLQNGTYDFSTGKLREHRPSDYFSKIAGAAFDANASPEPFKKFIGEIMSGEEQLISHLQRCFGYSLFGTNDLDVFFVCHGPTTRNGKSTLNNVMYHLLGDYAVSVDPLLFEDRRIKAINSREMEQRTALDGARYANIYEPDCGISLNGALIKAFTGGDTIRATQLYSKGYEFRTGAKIFFFTNPMIKISDPSILNSGRLVYIPFPRHFEPEEQDAGLETKLCKPEVLSGALNWLIDGALQVSAAQKIEMPPKVQAIYQKEIGVLLKTDGIEEFISERMEQDLLSQTPVGLLLREYRAFCIDHEGQFQQISDPAFRSRIKDILPTTNQTNGKILHVVGWRLRKGFDTVVDIVDAI